MAKATKNAAGKNTAGKNTALKSLTPVRPIARTAGRKGGAKAVVRPVKPVLRAVKPVLRAAAAKAKSLKKAAGPTRELKPGKGALRGAVAKAVMLPLRSKVKAADTWDLTVMFAGAQAWEQAYDRATAMVATYATFKGKLADSAGVVRGFFEFDTEFSRLMDRLGNYASLRTTEDQGDSEAQRLRGKYSHLATASGEAASFFRPEMMALPEEKVAAYLAAPELAEWRLAVERVVRYRPHTLSGGEERLLAMQGQMAEASNQIFRQLNDADMKFGTIRDESGRELELGHSSYLSLLQSPKRDVRKAAFHQYYGQYDAHKNTLAASLAASVHRDIYYARARNFATAREAALFPDNVPTTVYDNLIGSVRSNLPAAHRYVELRRRIMKLPDLHQYDTSVPFFHDLKKHHTWDAAVKVVCDSLAPLGTEYVETLREGMTTKRWCDRYPNAGKQSGAFSSGVYDSPPYILMNFREDVLEHVFTLTHEAGHSMHTWNSNRSQPYQYADYVIFVAEVASTFNEQLLARHLMDNAADDRERAYLITRQIDGIRSTIYRQTMFAEFERDVHAMGEAGEALTLESMRAAYRRLLDAYFGAAPAGAKSGSTKFVVDPQLELECLRIPHFYRAFYVYKYSTGLAAAITLSQKVLSKEPGALDRYLAFLKGGGSKFPLDLLKDAGVDMTTPAPVDEALKHFGELVEELETLV